MNMNSDFLILDPWMISHSFVGRLRLRTGFFPYARVSRRLIESEPVVELYDDSCSVVNTNIMITRA